MPFCPVSVPLSKAAAVRVWWQFVRTPVCVCVCICVRSGARWCVGRHDTGWPAGGRVPAVQVGRLLGKVEPEPGSSAGRVYLSTAEARCTGVQPNPLTRRPTAGESIAYLRHPRAKHVHDSGKPTAIPLPREFNGHSSGFSAPYGYRNGNNRMGMRAAYFVSVKHS